ncbi:hypothetical protein BDN72DRAFT_555529 [Pluteus cervinus]|uniref:Uncharacterized protein n=1 Tax=Pluteus cervinus TaxID=181527 RepID=A0ACD3A2M9_9AGAR|nr:hypothetical protein BDN72DRAFT_555529 [Pluteus cervinus]
MVRLEALPGHLPSSLRPDPIRRRQPKSVSSMWNYTYRHVHHHSLLQPKPHIPVNLNQRRSHAEPPVRSRIRYYQHRHIQRLFSYFPLHRTWHLRPSYDRCITCTSTIRNVFPSTYGSSSGYSASFRSHSSTGGSFGSGVVPGVVLLVDVEVYRSCWCWGR